MGSDEFIFRGFKGGILADGSTVNGFPFSSIILLCKSPSFAVKWYSSLVFVIIEWTLEGNPIVFDLFWWWRWWWWWEWCRSCCHELLLKVGFTWTAVVLSRLINSMVIPFCNAKFLCSVILTVCSFF